jgi:hypothetical protein
MAPVSDPLAQLTLLGVFKGVPDHEANGVSDSKPPPTSAYPDRLAAGTPNQQPEHQPSQAKSA